MSLINVRTTTTDLEIVVRPQKLILDAPRRADLPLAGFLLPDENGVSYLRSLIYFLGYALIECFAALASVFTNGHLFASGSERSRSSSTVVDVDFAALGRAAPGR